MAKKLINTKYRDFGEILNETNIANEGIGYSDWLSNTTWARRFILLIQSSQNYEIIIYRSDGTINDWGDLTNQGLGATSTSYASVTFEATETLGYKFRFGLRNKSGSATADFKLRLQAFNN